jgi:hypothetical protein
MADPKQRAIFQKVDAEGLKKRLDTILPRFEHYRAAEASLGAWGEDWLASERGTACLVREIGDRRLAIVGMNTAWLCHDDGDWGHLGGGKTMLEAALEDAKAHSPDLIVVLGHHPLAAMMGEEEWSDGPRIKRRLEQANAVYLHGHLHSSGAQQTGDTMESLLAIQAPSGFQAADSLVWRNGILWGEVDFELARLVIEPLQWNDDNQEYVFDSHAAPNRLRVKGRDAFAYPLPGREPAPEPAPRVSTEPDPLLPVGWQVVDPASLAEITATRPSPEAMVDWFNGSFPRWEAAVAEGVRPRQIVDDLARVFEAAHHAAPRPIVRLLTGAGGEGKSAALLQVVAKLLRGPNSWRCLWRQSSASQLPADWPTLVPRVDGQAWIIAIDDAENVGAGLPDALSSLGARTDVHLILAAREADWRLRGLNDGMWRGIADLRSLVMPGLDEEDARRIALGWSAWGAEAMGKLRGQTSEQAALTLLNNARTLVARKEEGTLLGALLMVREGEDLRERVSRLMAPWEAEPGIGGRSLLDIYAAIVAMHSENQLYLSRTILSYALGCEEADLDSRPLQTLRREAMVDGGTTYVLTRHRRIAEVARDRLIESGYPLNQWYPVLASAARSEFMSRRSGDPDINKWTFGLTQHFLRRGPSHWPIARETAKALFNFDPNDPLLLIQYASTLRKTKRPQEALALMVKHGPRFKRRRDVVYEWSVAAGLAGDHGLNAWLAGRSLADDRSSPLDAKQCKLSLAGLGDAFRYLAASASKPSLIKAQAACGRIGLRLVDLDPEAQRILGDHAKAEPSAANATGSLEKDIELLKKSVVIASWETEPDNDREVGGHIEESDTYQYRTLAEVVAGGSSSSARSQPGAARRGPSDPIRNRR